MQKISFLFLFSILFASPSLSALEAIVPEHAEAVNEIGCLIENITTPGGCGESGEGCQESSDSFSYYEDFPYSKCVKEICKDYPASVGQVLEERDKAAGQLKNSTEARFGPLVTNLFNALQENARLGQEYLSSDPAFAQKLEMRSTVISLQTDFAYTLAEESGPSGGLPSKRKMKRAIRAQYPGWSDQLITSNYDLVKLMREKLMGLEIIQRVRREATNEDTRRQLLGRLEASVRELPPESLSKVEFLTALYDLQSVHQISDGIPNAFLEKLEQLTVGVVYETVLNKDPQAIAIQNEIYRNAGDNKVTPSIYPEFINGMDRPRFVSTCLHALSEQTATLPTRNERSELQAQVQSTKVHIINSMREHLSRRTGSALGPRLNQMEVSLPPAREDFLDRMQALLGEKSGLVNYFKKGEAASSSVGFSGLGGINLANQFCRLPLELDANANALTTEMGGSHNHNHDRVTMGALIVKDFKNVGEHIFAHEVGHVVSTFIRETGSRDSKSAYEKMRSCLNRNQTGGGIGHLFSYLSGDPLAQGSKEEEDFADLFAFVALPQDRNRSCNAFFEGGAFFSGVNTVRSEGGAPHSADLYRLFHGEAVAGRELPQICREDMRQHGQEISLGNCWIDGEEERVRRENSSSSN
jgi:hypothetical protein